MMKRSTMISNVLATAFFFLGCLGTQIALADRDGAPHKDCNAGRKLYDGIFRHMDRNGDQRVNEEELLEMARQRFERMDHNSDGRLSVGEFKGRGRRMRMEMERFRRLADRDADGALSREEMLEGMRQRLRDMDADKDGSLTREEIHAHRKLQHFQELDRDQDGRLSREEFLAKRTPDRASKR